jgi:hypothetical protein
MAKQHMREGEIFALPILGGGYAVMLVACKGFRSLREGRFFLQRLIDLPSLSEAIDIISSGVPNIVYVHGPLGARDGTWVLLGSLPSFRKSEWIHTEFYFAGMDCVEILDETTLMECASRPVIRASDRELPRYVVGGHISIQNVLGQMLSPIAKELGFDANAAACEDAHRTRNTAAIAWVTAAAKFEKLGRIESAINAYRTALRITTDLELAAKANSNLARLTR